MNNGFYINRVSFRIVFPAVGGLILYLAMLMVFGNLSDLTGTFFSQEALFLVILTYLNHEWAIFLLGRRRIRESMKSPGLLHRVYYFLILATGTVMISSGTILAYFILILGYYHFITELITINILMLMFQLMVHLYFYSMQNIRRYHELLMEKEEMQGQHLELEMESFKSEMNPGLLMECLENLLSIMQKDIQESDRYIGALSDQYRYMLDNRQKEFTEMEEELKASRELVYLLNGGTGTRIILENEADDEKQALIPGTFLSIIYHAENTMILSPLLPLVLYLRRDDNGDLLLRYEHRPRLVQDHAISLDRLNSSYKHYTGRGLNRSEEDAWVEWKIPRLPEIIN
jgi:hypothetical protein